MFPVCARCSVVIRKHALSTIIGVCGAWVAQKSCHCCTVRDSYVPAPLTCLLVTHPRAHVLSNRRPPNIQAAFPFTHVTLRLQKPSERKMHQTAWRADSLTPEIWHTIFHTKYTTVRTAILTPIMVAFMFVALRLAGPRTLTQSTLLNKYAHMFYVCANGRAAPAATAMSRNPWPWAGHALNQQTHMQWTPPPPPPGMSATLIVPCSVEPRASGLQRLLHVLTQNAQHNTAQCSAAQCGCSCNSNTCAGAQYLDASISACLQDCPCSSGVAGWRCGPTAWHPLDSGSHCTWHDTDCGRCLCLGMVACWRGACKTAVDVC